MNKTVLSITASLCLAASNIVAQSNPPSPPAAGGTPVQPPTISTAAADPQQPPPPAAAAPPTPQRKDAPDPGVRKLSKRERKDRIAKLSDTYREFLRDVEPIMLPTELDTFLVLETDPQRDIYVTEFWRRRDVAQQTTNHTYRDLYYERL